MRIDRMNGKKIFMKNTHLLNTGVLLYRNHDHTFIQKVLNSDVKRKISVSFRMFQQETSLFLQVTDEDGLSVTEAIETAEVAKNYELARKTFLSQISKVGDHFLFEKLIIETEYLPFLPITNINEVRRLLLKRLIEIREKAFFSKDSARYELHAMYPEKELSFEANVMNSHAKKFYEKHGVKVVDQALELSLKFPKKRVMTMKSCLFCKIDKCSPGKRLSLVDSHGKEHILQCNPERCQTEICIKG